MVNKYYRHNLPHIELVGRAFFVTARLHNSIDLKTARKLKAERAKAYKALDQSQTAEEYEAASRRIEAAYFTKIEDLLDHPTHGERFLSEPVCRKILSDAIHEYDGKHYRLAAYCIMSNHLHILFDCNLDSIPENDKSPEARQLYVYQIMQKIKGKSGFYINKARGTSGRVWSDEDYDRYIRNEQHFTNSLSYTLNNPIKAGLVKDWRDWPGCWYWE